MSIRVVIVDDDAGLRRLLRMLLERHGAYTVVGEAEDGLQGLERIEELDPDVVLLDIAMPRLDGLQVLERLGGRPRPQAVVLTGFTDPGLCQQVTEAGAIACLQKGADFAGLPQEIERLVGGA